MKLPGVRLSVRLFVCPSVRSIIRPPHAAVAGLLLWAGGQQISIGSNREQWCFVSRRRKLNAVLFLLLSHFDISWQSAAVEGKQTH